MPLIPKRKWPLALLSTAAALTLATLLAHHFGLLHFRGQWMYQAQAQILFSDISPGTDSSLLDYVACQCAIVQKEREISMALQEQPWKSTGKGVSDAVVSEFASKLIVESHAGLVTITYLDEKSDTAVAAVRSTILAFKKFHADGDPEHTQDVLNVLDIDRQAIQNNITTLADQRKHILADPPLTPEALEKLYRSKVDEFAKTESMLLELEMNRDVLRSNMKNSRVIIPADAQVDPKPTPELDDLTQKINQQQLVVQRLKTEAQELDNKITQLHKIQEQENDVQRRLESITTKIDRLSADLKLAKRIDFLSEGEPAGQVLAEKQNGKWTKLGPTRP